MLGTFPYHDHSIFQYATYLCMYIYVGNMYTCSMDFKLFYISIIEDLCELHVPDACTEMLP